MPSSRDLHGARVLITGASSGVGAAAAEAFSRAGADVALLARSASGLEAVAARCPGRTLVLPADVTSQEAMDIAVRSVEDEWGGLDVAVSNAAAMVFGPFGAVEKKDFDRTVDATFLGAVNVIRAALPALERTGGTVVVTGSINGMTPLPSFSAYAASKAALRSFVRSLRIELGARRSKVKLTIVSPGAIATPVWRGVTSATGRLPRTPPEGYAAEVLGAAIVDAARRPRRREIVVGGEARFWLRLWRTPLLGDLVLTLVHLYYDSGRRPAVEDPLWEPAGDGATRGPILARPSLLERLRGR
jgi:NAD(P)-dependent dehydrogenase (short-subunit alcohol dehydrogenase family)